ncbi:hypothetical protein LTR17_004906 [Elasticomyces elasticus]|nr:hypothetical protein LTR17_004906 [Elasticomyces elasticus]
MLSDESVNVFRKAWDAMLADNERLHISKQVSWQPDVATWFPYDVSPGSTKIDEKNPNQGWEQLMEKLKQVEAFVRKIKATTPMEADEEGEELLTKEEEVKKRTRSDGCERRVDRVDYWGTYIHPINHETFAKLKTLAAPSSTPRREPEADRAHPLVLGPYTVHPMPSILRRAVQRAACA